jgi:predicted nucleic acid-binding protein
VSAVVDSSLVVAALIDAGRDGAWAEDVIAAGDLVAPHLMFAEATNILRRLERGRVLTAFEAATAHRDLMRLDVALVAFEPCAERVWELRGRVSSYDAWYVAVAEALDVPLATLDRRLSRATGPTCRFLLPA